MALKPVHKAAVARQQRREGIARDARNTERRQAETAAAAQADRITTTAGILSRNKLAHDQRVRDRTRPTQDAPATVDDNEPLPALVEDYSSDGYAGYGEKNLNVLGCDWLRLEFFQENWSLSPDGQINDEPQARKFICEHEPLSLRELLDAL